MTYTKNIFSVTFIVLLILVALVQSLKMIQTGSEEKYKSLFLGEPIIFEENRGQFDSHVDFVSNNKDLSFHLTNDHIEVSLNDGNKIKIDFIDANEYSKAEGINQRSGHINYLSGRNKEHWQQNIPLYEKVVYRSIYPGIDLIYHSDNGLFEYDFIISPGVDYSDIILKFSGAEKIELSDTGDLLLHLKQGTVIHKAPVVYQNSNGGKLLIESNYLLADNNRVVFNIADYDRSKPLIIDPVITYNSYFGGKERDEGNDITIDSDGNVYIIGSTNSNDLPTDSSSLYSEKGGDYDIFVSKFNSDNELLFSTYLGGSADDKGTSIFVDDKGYIYIAGETISRDFPTVFPLQPTLSGDKNCNEGKDDCNDAFVAKLSADGSDLLFSTYLGGDNREIARSLVVDENENVYMTGVTTSYNFPLQNEIQSTLKQQQVSDYELRELCGVNLNIETYADIFISKIDTKNANYIFSTYLGGTCIDSAFGIDIDSDKNIFVTGVTSSSDFPVKVDIDVCKELSIEEEDCLPFQEDFKFQTDVFLVKLNSLGDKILYATYFGDTGSEIGLDVAVDDFGSAYITGYTDSPELAHISPFNGKHSGNRDAFIAKFSAERGGLVYSSYLGGSDDDEGHGIAVNVEDEIYIVGKTNSEDFPVKNPLRGIYGGSGDAFITKLCFPGNQCEPDGTAANTLQLVYSSYLGGNAKDSAQSVVLTNEPLDPDVLLIGNTKSKNLTVVSPLSRFTDNQGKGDLFISRLKNIGAETDLAITVDDLQDPVIGEENFSYVVTVKNQGPDDATGVIVSATLSEGLDYISHSMDMDGGNCTFTRSNNKNGREKLINTLECFFSTIAVNEQINIDILARATRGGVVDNTVRIVSANQSDPYLSNNVFIDETRVGIKGGGGVLSIVSLFCLLFYMLLRMRKTL